MNQMLKPYLPTYLPTYYLPTSCGAVLLEELLITQLVKKSPSFKGTLSSITVLTTARHWSPS